MKVSIIAPMSDDNLESHLGCEFEETLPDIFTFEGDDGCEGEAIADDVGVEVTIQDATGNYICLALEWTIADHNRTILKLLRASAMNCFGGRLLATHLALMGFIKAA